MSDNRTVGRGTIVFLLIAFSVTYLIVSCAQAPTKTEITGIAEEGAAQIESVNVISRPSEKGTAIEITSSQPVTYTAFKLVQPLRLVVDVNARLAKGLTGPAEILC
jgi:hypothetical protein